MTDPMTDSGHSNNGDNGNGPEKPTSNLIFLPQKRVAADLRKRIAAGEWASGDKLPSARVLAAEYSTSHGTVWKALRILVDEGLIASEPRYGIFRL